MSTDANEMKYYFGFRVINPTGSWVVQGPFDTNEQVKAARERAKASDAQVTIPIVAKSKEEALSKCDLY